MAARDKPTAALPARTTLPAPVAADEAAAAAELVADPAADEREAAAPEVVPAAVPELIELAPEVELMEPVAAAAAAVPDEEALPEAADEEPDEGPALMAAAQTEVTAALMAVKCQPDGIIRSQESLALNITGGASRLEQTRGHRVFDRVLAGGTLAVEVGGTAARTADGSGETLLGASGQALALSGYRRAERQRSESEGLVLHCRGVVGFGMMGGSEQITRME
ncbi:hypothetical protein CAC42_3268 [Sphaceloma murrayae]|uniref:Uncharacterized protein n=1 Tax=Sphaceloma murrayae TaxID=2082308 RepID=A0A2K1QFF7_9PEZI|nr:hypothetical protein CAC42_3268 [Sphaceloma murrayae]